ncbi:hypothetical protein ZIOFF_001571 [Zingiber officinale]|uniref:Uncharacterized protein n=1 Tax=Zingiber officinale TaxID=94328 RepID=A0A8J5IMV1_ZINOF|nr:hypothetical protein ZIOFF_001571 [Zingiber officinale]
MAEYHIGWIIGNGKIKLWAGICVNFERYGLTLRIILGNDAKHRGNPGLSSYGFIVRDFNGHVIRAMHGIIDSMVALHIIGLLLEANAAADHLANRAPFHFEDIILFSHNINKELYGICKLDKIEGGAASGGGASVDYWEDVVELLVKLGLVFGLPLGVADFHEFSWQKDVEGICLE